MRPGHLNVFDGLRVTTEHMNYLQGSFHSAVEDLREVLGLGVVHKGLDVTVKGNSVTVSPGLAFDFQGNRIVLDQEVTIDLNFGADETTKYVCVKYDQVEDGEIEGRFTLVWDSAKVELQPALPDAAENLVVIARLDRVNGNGAVKVNKFSSQESDKSPPETPSPEPVPTKVITVVQQGVARLSNSATSASVKLEFEPLSLTCHTIVTAKEQDSVVNPAQGEVTFGADGVSQFGVAGSKFIENAIASLPIKSADSPELLIKVNQSDSNGFVINSEDQGSVVEWEALVAWKALGESRG